MDRVIKKYYGVFKNIRAATFKERKYERIEKIIIKDNYTSSFFYPKYHFGDFRYCWGMPYTFWDRGSLILEELLEDIYFKFRAGSRISIYFTLGFALVLKGQNREKYCIRFEKEYGYGTSIADANNDFKKLRRLFNFFNQKRKTKESIKWALRNIKDFGYFDGKKLVLNDYFHKTYYFNWRNFTQQEITFITNKLNKNKYCADMIKEYYYSSDAFYLKEYVGNKNAKTKILVIP